MHLNDCRLSAQDGITHSQEILRRLGKIIHFFAISQPLWDAGISWSKRLASIDADLQYLYDELTSAGKGIEELQSMVLSPRLHVYARVLTLRSFENILV
jgi:hypothetical protein